MLVIHGVYRLFTRKSACKNQFCTRCWQPRFTEGFRSFRIVHVYYIPLVPIGFHTDWRCTKCGADPLSRRPMAKWLLICGLAGGVLGLCAAIFIPDTDRDMLVTRAVMVVMFGSLAVGMVATLRKGRRSLYAKQQKLVTPLRRDVCPYCDGHIFQRSVARCERCNITIR